MSTELVIYHANCYDGFTAAWIAKRAMPECELFPAKYGEPPPSVVGRHVYVLDFSYPREVMERMAKEAKLLVVLDHHKTAEEACRGLDFCTFDMERSGAGMTWDYFHPDKLRPWLVDRIEDRDLWRFKYDETRAAHALVASMPMTLENWDTLFDLHGDDVLWRGECIQRYIDTYCEKMAAEACFIEIDEQRIVVCNAPYLNCSELGHHLLATFPDADYSLTYYQRSDRCWQWSLRSRPGFDVSKIAQQYGGGGHAQAAGFETLELLEWLQ